MSRLSHPFISELKRYVANQNATLGPVVLSLSELIRRRPAQAASVKKGGQPPDQAVQAKQHKLSEVTDMIHAAHVFHRCVRGAQTQVPCDSPSGKVSAAGTSNTTEACGGGATSASVSKRLHQDNIMSLLVGDYLLAQSSVDMADLRCPPAVGLIAKGLEDYTRGEFLKMQLAEELQRHKLSSEALSAGLDRYAQLTCGSLLSNACQSSALLEGHERLERRDEEKLEASDSISDDLGALGAPGEEASGRRQDAGVTRLVSTFGFHWGSAHRLMEILYCPDTNSDTDEVLISSLDSGRLKRAMRRHVEGAKRALQLLPGGGQCAPLVTMLDDMRGRC